jgi:hypothetical protein
MPRLDPKVAARFSDFHPQVPRTFRYEMASGAPTLDEWTNAVAACYANGVPRNALLQAEETYLVARWAVPMADYPRNR